MDAAVIRGFINVNVFHDVDFTACWPVGRWKIVSQQPECRPHSQPGWNLYASLKSSVNLTKSSLRLEARRSITALHAAGARELFPCGLNHEVAILQPQVFGARRIVFQFFVPPTV